MCLQQLIYLILYQCKTRTFTKPLWASSAQDTEETQKTSHDQSNYELSAPVGLICKKINHNEHITIW